MATPISLQGSESNRNSWISQDEFLPDRPRFNPVDFRALEYVSAYDHNLMCAICHCPFVFPVRLDCEHVFCRQCVDRALRNQHESSRSCPSCRRQAVITTAAPKILNRILDELLVKCPLHTEGCLDVVPRCQVQDHILKYCSYFEVDCPSEDCLLTLRRKDADDGRCLHYLVECEDCMQSIPKRDLEVHRTRQCEAGKVACPDCNEQVLVRDLDSHIGFCPNAIFSCNAAKYGCDYIDKRTNLEEHLKTCALAKLMPFLKTQDDRLEAQEAALKHLRHKNSIMETSVLGIMETLESSSNLFNESQSVLSASTEATPASTAQHLLCLHESLRQEVSRVSNAISEVDTKASMMVMNESLRVKEDFARNNAAIGGMRMQLHWLMAAKLQEQQRVATVRARASEDGLGMGTSSAAADELRSHAGIRRLSDSTRQETKL